MDLHIYRKDIKMGGLQSYIIYVDGNSKTSLDVGQTTQLDLPPGNHSLTVKPYLPIEYADAFVKFLSKINPAHSDKIELELTQATGSEYVLVENRNKSYLDTLKNIFLSVLNLILFQKRNPKIRVKKVSEENFKKSKKEGSEVKHYTTQAKRFVFREMITAFFLAIFGVCVYSLTTGWARSLSIPLFLVFIGVITKFSGYRFLSKPVLSPPSLKIFRIRVLIYEICLAVIAFHSVTSSFIFGVSLLFIAVYALIFFKAKPLLAK